MHAARIAIAVLAFGGWIALLALVGDVTDDGVLQAGLAIAGGVVVGLVVGRWWTVWVPPAAVVLVFLVSLALWGSEPTDEIGIVGWGLLMLCFGVVGAVALAAGVAGHQALGRSRRERSRRGVTSA